MSEALTEIIDTTFDLFCAMIGFLWLLKGVSMMYQFLDTYQYIYGG